MRKLVLPIAMIGLFSCKPSQEDSCKCLKESANDYMLKGVKPSIEDLAMTCKINKDDYDRKEKTELVACAAEIVEHINSKTLIKIDSNALPDFPSYTFSTTQDFLNDLGKSIDNEYKYFRTHITVTAAYSTDKPIRVDQSTTRLFASDQSGSGAILIYGNPNGFDDTKFSQPTGISSYDGDDIVWDFKEKKSISTGFYDGRLIKWLIEDASGQRSNALYGATIREMQNDNVDLYFAKELREVMAMENYTNLVEDMANGRYKIISVSQMPSGGKENTKFSFTGTYFGNQSAQNNNGIISGNTIGEAKIFDIEGVSLSSEFSTPGKSIDIKKYVAR